LWAAIERRIWNQESAIANASGSTAAIDQSGQLNMVSQINTAPLSPFFANISAIRQYAANL
jgi:hypothetical protein